VTPRGVDGTGGKRGSRRGDDGAVAVLVGLMVTVLIAFGSFAVDLGMQRVGRRDMQALADMVSMDMARLLDGRTASQVTSDPAWQSTLHDSIARNDTTLGDPPTVQAEVGTTGGPSDFTPVDPASTTVPNAVRVTASTTVPFAISGGKGGAVRSAVSTSASTACFSIGSYALDMNSGNASLVKPLIEDALGGSVNIPVVSYQGLAGASVSLEDLAAQLHVLRVTDLAGTTVSVASFYLAIANVLQQHGDTADATVLQVLSTHLGVVGDVNLGHVLAIAGGGDSAAAASVKALDLVAGTAFVANGSNGLALPATTLNALGLASATASLHLIEGPRVGCGKINAGTASTSQVGLTVSGKVSTLPTLLGTLTTTAPSPTSLSLSVASATGTLSKVVCGAASSVSPEGMDVAVATGLASATLSLPVHVAGTINVAGIGLVNLNVDVTSTVALNSPGTNQTASVRVPTTNPTYDVPTSVGSGQLKLSGLAVTSTTSNLTATVLGLPVAPSALAATLSSIVSAVQLQIVAPTTTTMDANLVVPLTSWLGLKVAGADVFGIPRPDCTSPQLVG
jgi:uncharacterized membrane protein